MSRAYRQTTPVFRQSNIAATYLSRASLGAEDYVHCPVCNLSYAPDQTETHILRHTLSTVPVSKVDNAETRTQASSYALIAYPMVEPLEFDVNSLVQSGRKEILKLAKQQKNKKSGKVIEMVDRQTQTLNRPLLQENSEERDLYNCFDNFFNGGSLRYADVVDNNVGLASKRQLSEWEIQRINK